MAAEHDLDNLRLADLGEGVVAMEAEYELEALMLTGMVLDLASLAARLREQVSGGGWAGWAGGAWGGVGRRGAVCSNSLSLAPQPAPAPQIHPRGVQLQLLPLSAPEGAPPLVDTLVMSNLGYFQLKSGPGLWKLRLAPGQRRRQLGAGDAHQGSLHACCMGLLAGAHCFREGTNYGLCPALPCPALPCPAPFTLQAAPKSSTTSHPPPAPPPAARRPRRWRAPTPGRCRWR